jgi:hypothetical protein
MDHAKKATRTTRKKHPIELAFKKPTNSQEWLEEINQTEEQMKQVKACLAELVENIQNNQSFMTRMALIWGQIPLWQKAIAGILIFGGLLTLGILTHTAILIAVTSVCAVVSLVVSLCLDNHHKVEKVSREKLKTSILNLANMLGHVIHALDMIRLQLAAEIDRLTQQIFHLDESIETLDHEVVLLRPNVKLLATQTQRLGEVEQALSNNQIEFEKTKSALNEKIFALTALEEQLGQQVDSLTANNILLRATIDTLSQEIIKMEPQRQAFLQKLDDFLENKEVSFHEITDRICLAEQELTKTKADLKRCIKHYENLLNKNEVQVKRLTKAADVILRPKIVKLNLHKKKVEPEDKPLREELSPAKILSKYGFRGRLKDSSHTPHIIAGPQL